MKDRARFSVMLRGAGGLAVLAGCLRGGTTSEQPHDSFSTLANAMPHSTMVGPRAEAFARDPDGDAFVSGGWRATASQRFDALGARVPSRADAAVDVGVSRFDRLRLRITLEGAAPVFATLDGGRVLFADALPETDRVLVSNDTTLEELLVVKNARAPRSFRWHIARPEGLTAVAFPDGTVRFEDARHHAAITMPAPRAWDTSGREVALRAFYDTAAGDLLLTLPTTNEVWPVVVDPTFETSTWLNVNRTYPSTAQRISYDAERRSIVAVSDTAGAMSGPNNDTWLWDGTAWSLRATTVTPAPTSTMVYDEVRRETMFLGRYGGAGADNRVCTWNGSVWSVRDVTVHPVKGSVFVFDAARGEVLAFGGFDPSTGVAANETWAWNGSTWTQRLPAASPPIRTNFGLAYDRARREVVLFGGTAGGTRLNDTWVWDGTTWTQRTTALAPSTRSGHAMTYDSARAEVVLFGGTPNGGTQLNDTWVWNGNAWTQRTTAVTPTSVYATSGFTFDEARGQAILLNADTWAWDGSTWSRVASPPTQPTNRPGMAGAYDAARKNVVIHGGATGSISNETWTWNGSVWARATPATAATARFNAAMAYDALHQNVVLFGGQGPAPSFPRYSDTWTWNGSTWTARSVATPPPARIAHALAFDAARGEVVLFGGNGPSTYLGDTWVWNGTTWTQRAPTASPSARATAAMTYDARRAKVLLFGGATAGGTTADDTWTWDGTTWVESVVTLRPRARYGAALMFDTVHGDAILFGGQADSSTWAWDGTTWTSRNTTYVPSITSGAVFTFDEERKQGVYYSGYDTWLHETSGDTCTTDSDCLNSFCNDGVCCNVQTCGVCSTCAGINPGRCTPVTNREDKDSCALSDHKSCSDLAECKRALGEATTNVAECASGFIVDGVCCATSSCGPCETCNPALKEHDELPGICSAAKAGTNPHDACEDMGATSCQRNGKCDGNRGCQLYDDKTACGEGGQMCSGAGKCILPSAASCDGNHTVVSPDGTRVDCGVYKCAGSMCMSSCSSKADCSNGADCTADHSCIAFREVFPPPSGGCSVTARDRHAPWVAAIFASIVRGAGWRRRRQRERIARGAKR